MLIFLKNNKPFVWLTSINLISKFGDRLFYTAMLTAAISLPNSSLAITIVSASETLPILLSLFLGVVADKQTQKINQLIKNSIFRTFMYLGIGLLFQYPQTLILIILASILNLISDISGNYSTALFSPFTKALIKSEDMQEAQGFINVGTQLVSVISTFVGASLLTIYTKSSLAMINASIFFIVTFLYWFSQPSLKVQEKTIKVNEREETFSLVRDNIYNIFSERHVLINIIQLAMLNGFFGGLTPLFALFIKNNNDLLSFSNATKIALLSGIITTSMILGNSLTTKVLNKYSIFHINLWSDLLILIVGVGFIVNNIWMIFFANSSLAFLLGAVSPRFSADIVNRYPIERIGGIITAMNAFLVIMPPLTSLLFPILATVSPLFAYTTLIFYALLLIGISLWLSRKVKEY